MSTSALPVSVALVSNSQGIGRGQLDPVAAALQKQVQRDFAPIWHVNATVAAFNAESDIPHGYWPLIIEDNLDQPDALGYHTDKAHQPVSFVAATPDWSTTCSHELLEMLADPWGNRLWSAQSPAQDGTRVRILIEVADPCEATSYEIEGIKVSDFALPNWYHTVKRQGSHYSFCGVLTHPRAINRGGYVSYEEADGTWWQQTWWGVGPEAKELGRLEEFKQKDESIREAVDRLVRTHRAQSGLH